MTTSCSSRIFATFLCATGAALLCVAGVAGCSTSQPSGGRPAGSAVVLSRILDTVPAFDSVGIPVDSSIEFTVSPAASGVRVVLEPDTGVSFIATSDLTTGERRVYRPERLLQPMTLYEVTVTVGQADSASGREVTQSYSWTFTTAR